MDVDELRAAVQKNVIELRQALAKEEAFLTELDARVAPQRRPAPERAPEKVVKPIAATTSELRRLSRSEKTKLALAYIAERPGRWTTAQMRAALEHSGIDPEAGTPVKNILWHIAKDGRGESIGHGEYDFPAERRNGAAPNQETLS